MIFELYFDNGRDLENYWMSLENKFLSPFPQSGHQLRRETLLIDPFPDWILVLEIKNLLCPAFRSRRGVGNCCCRGSHGLLCKAGRWIVEYSSFARFLIRFVAISLMEIWISRTGLRFANSSKLQLLELLCFRLAPYWELSVGTRCKIAGVLISQNRPDPWRDRDVGISRDRNTPRQRMQRFQLDSKILELVRTVNLR